MIEPAAYAAYLLTCVAVVIVPGPTVTVIVANALRHGAAAGLANVAGTQAGLALMLVALAAGMSLVVEALGALFDVLKLIGAGYLIYLGVRLLANRQPLDPAAEVAPPAPRSFFWQGFWVVGSNPKALLFFGAFLPPFVEPDGPVMAQTLLLGATFMAVATLLDGGYALLAGSARRRLTRAKIRALEIVGGAALIGGGVALALSRRS